MTKSQISKAIFAAILLGSVIARADVTTPETWTVSGKIYTTKAEAIRAVVSAGKRVDVIHTRCEQLNNNLAFKACPKNKNQDFGKLQFESLSQTK